MTKPSHIPVYRGATADGKFVEILSLFNLLALGIKRHLFLRESLGRCIIQTSSVHTLSLQAVHNVQQ